MSRIFDDYVQKPNSLAIKLPIFFAEFDNKTRTLDISPYDIMYSLYNKHGVLDLVKKSGEKTIPESLEILNQHYTLNVDLIPSNNESKLKNQLLTKIMNAMNNGHFTIDLNCN